VYPKTAEEQSVVVEEINQRVVSVQGMSIKTADSMENTRASSQSLGDLSKQIHQLASLFWKS